MTQICELIIVSLVFSSPVGEGFAKADAVFIHKANGTHAQIFTAPRSPRLEIPENLSQPTRQKAGGRRREERKKGMWGNTADAALRQHACACVCVCSAVPTTYAQLSNDKTLWENLCPLSSPAYQTVTVAVTQP